VRGADGSANDPEIPVGGIVATNPPAGSIVPPGTSVSFIISLGPVTANTVPNVVNLQQGDGEDLIIQAGLTVGAVTLVTDARAPGTIISSNPVAGTVLAAGSAVALRVSLGPAGLALALSFDEPSGTVVADSSAWRNNGAARQATMTRAPSQAGHGNAMRFDGVDDWVTVTDVAGSPIDLSSAGTIEAWVNPTAFTGWETIMLKERGTLNLSYGLYAHDGGTEPGGQSVPAGYIRQAPATSTADQGVRGLGALPLGAWTHVAMTWDGGVQRLYVNGTLVGTNEPVTVGGIVQANGALRIGGNASFTGEFFQGLIDDVRVYRTVRTAAQIQSDMSTPVVLP
jgi:hypothetical protein